MARPGVHPRGNRVEFARQIPRDDPAGGPPTPRLEQRLDESKIQTVWSQILDPTLVAHAKPAGFAKGTLFVHVDSSVWLDEIVRYRRHEMLERLQTALGKTVVQRISFRLG